MTRGLPSINVNFEDFQLGLVPPISRGHAKVGVAAAGRYTPQSFTKGSGVVTEYQGGPLAGAAAVALLQVAPITCVRVNATTPGTLGAVTRKGTTGTSVMTATGTPNDAYDVTLRVTRAGTIADGDTAVTITRNGVTSVELAVPVGGELVIPNTGVTVNFAAGSLVKDETYAFTSTAPAATVSELALAVENLLATRPDLRHVHVLGAATPALAAAVDAILTERETRNYYTNALLEARPMTAGESMSDYLAAIEAQFAGFSSTRVAIALDGGDVYNPVTRLLEHRSSAWKLTAHRARQTIGDAPYRVRAGAVPAMGALRFDANLTGTAGRFAALRTLDGREGVFMAAWPMMAPAGSDFDEIQQREVIDRAAQIGYISALDYLGDDIDVDTATGRIAETKALAMETFIEGRVRAGLGGEASGVRVRVDREQNILATRHITFDLSVIPLGYMKSITVNVSFVNPMLAALSAAPPTDAGATTGGTA